jgi:hypothetical protein
MSDYFHPLLGPYSPRRAALSWARMPLARRAASVRSIAATLSLADWPSRRA